MPKQCNEPGCTRNVFGGKKCDWHQRLRTDKKPKKIKSASASYAKELKKYSDRVPQWKEENPICAFPGCGMPTVDCHHSYGRGIFLNREDTWIPLCREHHDICKTDPERAKEAGLIYSRTTSRKRS